MKNQIFTQQVNILAGTKGQGRNVKFANKVQITTKLAHDILNGQVPKWDVLIKISTAYKKSINWLLTGKEFGRPIYTAEIVVLSPDEAKRRVVEKGKCGDEYIPLPLYCDCASLGAGGAISDNEIEGFALIHKSKMPGNANAGCIRLSGDSMLPEIKDGDIVCVDCNQRNYKLLNKKLVAVNLTPGSASPEITIKELRLRKNKFYFHAYNPAWEAEHGQIEIDIQDDVILGKVITLWRGFK